MSASLDRARLLYNTRRYDLAERELRHALGEAPDDAEAHALLSMCLAQLERAEPSIDHARRAIALRPDDVQGHFALALALHLADRDREALDPARNVVAMDPYDAQGFALLGGILAARRQWAETLDAAEQGLSIDAENVQCSNLRALALTKLGRREEAGATLDATLMRDPHNATTHANRGWALLHEGDPRRALEHFSEALRLDANHEWARAGIVEALKARNIVYRLFLRYMLWMSRLSPRAAWAFMIGVVVVINLLVRLPDGPLYWFGFSVGMAYFAFVVGVWTAVPTFNLLLRLDRFGRRALTDEQRADSTLMGAAIAAVVALVAVNFAVIARPFDTLSYLMLLMATGVSLNLPRRVGRNRKFALAATAALFAIAALYCFRWATWDATVYRGGLEAMKAYEAVHPGWSERTLAFLEGQSGLRQVFSWGAIAMTWFAPMLATRRR